jgi:hypothetical protein
MTPFLFLSVARLDLRGRGRDLAASRGMGDVRGRLVGARKSKPRPLAFCAFPVDLLLTTRASSDRERRKGGRAAQSTARQSARQLLMISFSAEDITFAGKSSVHPPDENAAAAGVYVASRPPRVKNDVRMHT